MASKKDLRENLPLPVFENTNEKELFQNQILRPVLKLQNDVYMLLFREYAVGKMQDFDSMTTDKKHNFIDQSLQKDNYLRNTLIGITLGMLTAEEIKTYLAESKSFNKRIVGMLCERIKSQV